MKVKNFRFLSCVLVFFSAYSPIFSQPKLLDVSSKVNYDIEMHLNGGTQNPANKEICASDMARLLMADEMVTVIPAGKKVNLENFAGTSGIQVINAYKIAKHEVTQELYMAVMGENPSYFKDDPDDGEIQEKRPVECVTWYEACDFCNKLSELLGLTPCYDKSYICNYNANGYRLPTESEWEMAARGGVAGGWDNIYAGSNKIKEVAWYRGNSDEKTHEVGKKNPNSLGLYDMSGNVWEWCDSRWEPSSSYRVDRGGSWSRDDGCKVFYRSYGSPNNSFSRLGLRLVCSVF